MSHSAWSAWIEILYEAYFLNVAVVVALRMECVD